MASYVISDIHGEADRFDRMLETVGFSENDTLYILGDVLDRGPAGVELLERIRSAPNMVMLLGNHEYMCLQCFSPNATEKDHRRWTRNGNAPTLAGLDALSDGEREDLLRYLKALPTFLEVRVGERDFYLVHGFPGESVHDRVWGRPTLDTPNPIPGRQLIIGHTPVLSLLVEEALEDAYIFRMASRGERLTILHTPGYIDIDCGCGHPLPVKALACLRLDDGAEFYV